MKIIIPYDLAKMSGKELAVYSYIYTSGLAAHSSDTLYLNSWEIGKNVGITPHEIKYIVDKLAELPELSIQKQGSCRYTVLRSELYAPRASFVAVEFTDINTILQYATAMRYNLLLFLCWVLKKVDYDAEVDGHKYFVTQMPLAYFQKVMGVSVSSILQYVSLLERMGILYVFRVGNMPHHNNLMGLRANKNLIDAWAELNGLFRKSDLPINYRELGLKYKAAVNGKKYSKEELDEMRRGIREYNKTHPGKEKDLSLLNKIIEL